MKKLSLVVISLLAGVAVLAQDLPINTQTNKITFMEVVDAEGLSGKQLYDLAKEFGTDQGWTVIEDDAASGKIKFQAKIELGWPGLSGGQIDKGFTAFTYIVDGKDDRYRYIFTDFEHKGVGKSPSGGALENTQAECGPTRMSARGWVTIKEKTSKGAKDLVADLKQKIQEVKNDPESNDDW